MALPFQAIQGCEAQKGEIRNLASKSTLQDTKGEVRGRHGAKTRQQKDAIRNSDIRCRLLLVC